MNGLRKKSGLEDALILQIQRSFAVLALIICPLATGRESPPIAIFDSPPSNLPTQAMTSGALLGNGDVGVTMGGPSENQRYYIGKNDFWRQVEPSIVTVGYLNLSIPSLQGASYREEQDMALAEVRGTFAKDNETIQTRSWVEATQNLLFIEVSNHGSKSVPISVSINGGEAGPQLDIKGTELTIGRDSIRVGRGYFQGRMLDVSVQPRAIPPQEAEIMGGKAPADDAGKSYDGKTDFDSQPAPTFGKAISISAWLKIEASTRGGNYIVSLGKGDHGLFLRVDRNRLQWRVGDRSIISNDPLEMNKWIHVIAVADDRQMVEYVDGKVAASIGQSPPATIDRSLVATSVTCRADASPTSREVTMVARLIAEGGSIGSDDALSMTLRPGATATVVVAIISDLDSKADAATALNSVRALHPSDLLEQAARHRKWWADFWAKSSIEIPDKVLETHWYAALYTIGCCSRAGKVAPGLWGNWITTNSPLWHGDFHLNYNFESPFYIVYSSNHPELSLPFYDALDQSISEGRAMASRHGWKGIHFSNCIGPWGMHPEDADGDYGQRSNAAFAALNFIWYWQYTQDRDWLQQTGYPYLRGVADFWVDYLKLENGRYVDENDSIHEGSGPDVNPILSLALIRTLLTNTLAASQLLGIDADQRPKWQDILDHLSAFPTQEKEGKEVFRYSEKGTAWWSSNTLGIQHIFPGGAIGLHSDPKLLEISRNTIDVLNRWDDSNGFCSWYTACARSGYNPTVILDKLHAECIGRRAMPNMVLSFSGGGVENVSGFLCLNEMLLQSYDGILHLFPCWPRDQEARFEGLRAVGAFVVSAEIKNGEIGPVKIICEKGGDCTIDNPWPGSSVQLDRNVTKPELLTGRRFSFKTAAGEVITLVKSG